ncbi:glycosyltransferase family 2 protein [Pseudomonas sp. 2FG]|uniref:glycosyltransferase family 2 protein n=1 Tax=Pseudomonas sp. 2FG TaxID=2502191 RepID=UPI001C49A242|nr:glycosyltransferase family 2 protein [Pseudomonas sp. 2FG]
MIIVNWNTFDVLERCLAALAGQQAPIHRTIVIDNASRNPPEALPSQRPADTHYIRLAENVGFARANNLGVAELQDCEWIALVNPDAFLAPDCLEQLLQAAMRQPQVGCFGAVTLMAQDPTRLDGIGDAYHASGLCWRLGHGVPLNEESLQERLIFSPCAATALYRRDLYEAVGGLDEDFFCYCEDVDLGFRLWLAGHQCRLVPTARALHVGSASSGGQKSDFALYHGHRNLVWTYVKNMPGALFWLMLPAHILMNLLTTLIYVCRGRGRVLLRAKWDAIRGLPRMWRKRRAIQAQRQAGIRSIWRLLDKGLGRRYKIAKRSLL